MDLKDYELFFDVNGASKHLGSDVEYNERNHGFGISAEKEDLKSRVIDILTAGTYKNSFGDQSSYVGGGVAKRFGDEYYADIGAVLGAVTGYEDGISPLAALYLSVGKKNKMKLRTLYTPRTEKSPELLMFNLGIPFK